MGSDDKINGIDVFRCLFAILRHIFVYLSIKTFVLGFP